MASAAAMMTRGFTLDGTVDVITEGESKRQRLAFCISVPIERLEEAQELYEALEDRNLDVVMHLGSWMRHFTTVRKLVRNQEQSPQSRSWRSNDGTAR